MIRFRCLNCIECRRFNKAACLETPLGSHATYLTCSTRKCACRQWPKQGRLWLGEIEPRSQVIPLKDNHLAIMYRRDVGSGRRREEGERVAGPVGRRPPWSGAALSPRGRVRYVDKATCVGKGTPPDDE